MWGAILKSGLIMSGFSVFTLVPHKSKHPPSGVTLLTLHTPTFVWLTAVSLRTFGLSGYFCPAHWFTIMSSSRFAMSKVLDSVGAAASTVTTTLTTIESAVNVLANAVEQIEYKQSVRHTAERDSYVETIIREASLEESKQLEVLRKSEAKGEFLAADYESASSRLRAALADKGLIPVAPKA